MNPRYLLLASLLTAVATVSAQNAERTTARDARVPAVANAAAFSVW